MFLIIIFNYKKKRGLNIIMFYRMILLNKIGVKADSSILKN